MADHVLCGMSELSYSPVKLLQNEIEYSYTTELTPHNSIIAGNNIIFHIEGGTDFVDLAHTSLEIDVKVTQVDGTALTEQTKVAPINNILHSVFSQVQVKLKDTVISHPSPNYGYRAYLETLLNYDRQAKDTWLKSQGWYFDQAGEFDTAANTAVALRRSLVVNKKILTLKGRLATNIGAQPLLVPSQTDIVLTLTPQRPEFALMRLDDADTKSYKIEIAAAKLNVRKSKLYPDAVNKFEKDIAAKPVSIPISQVRVSTVSISQGLFHYSHNSLFNGILPNYVVIGFVTNASYCGSWSKNPFNFAHADLSHIQLKVNERLVPSLPITPRFAEEKVIEGYESLYSVVGKLYQNWSNGLHIFDYCNGAALYGFVLNNDTLCRHDSQNLQGHVDIDVKFSAGLPETMTMVVYSSTQGHVIIDGHRNILLDV